MTCLLNTVTGRIVAEFPSVDLAEDRLEAIDYACPRLGALLDVYVLGDNGWTSAYAPSVIAMRVMRFKAAVAA